MNDVVDSIIAALITASKAHMAGKYELLSGIHKSVEGLPQPPDEPAAHNKAIAVNFLDGWADASNHDWQYYDGIYREDWPELAHEIAHSLLENREITAPQILKNFDLRGSARESTILGWIRQLLPG